MPPAHYWFTGAALFQAAAFIFATIVALVGIISMISDKVFYILLVIAIGLSFMAWKTAANQEQESSENKSTLALIRAALLPLGSTYTIEDSSNLSNEEIRNRVFGLTSQLRSFESQFKREQQTTLDEMTSLDPTYSPETSAVMWRERSAKLSRQYAESDNQFRERYFPTAVALRDEMLRRLHIDPNDRGNKEIVALQYGVLAGVSPISQAALYLEKLARQLPK